MVAKKVTSSDQLFKGRHFEREIIILCVRWYLCFKLSFGDLVEMTERDLSLAHTVATAIAGGRATTLAAIRSSQESSVVLQDHFDGILPLPMPPDSEGLRPAFVAEQSSNPERMDHFWTDTTDQVLLFGMMPACAAMLQSDIGVS
jgi:hypothetical protein